MPAAPDALRTRPIVLAARWQHYGRTGDRKARDDLVLAYSPIVKYAAGRIASRMPAHVDAADLMSDGFKGLLEAVERFEPSRGTGFPAYAEQRVRGAIFDGLRSLDWVPRSVRREARDIERATAALAMRLRRMPTDAQLGAELSLSPEQLQASLQRVSDAHIVALDQPWGSVLSDGGPSTLGDTLPGPVSSDPATRVDADERHQRIGAAVAQLPERDRLILGLHYHQELNFTQIGEILKVSGSQVSRLHTQAGLRLKVLLT